MAEKLSKSSPAQNALPSPESTTTLTELFSDKVSNAWAMASIISGLKAFIFFGRLRRTSAI